MSMPKYGNNFRDEAPNVLLTEGKTDCHVVLALRDAYKIPRDSFGFHDCGSDEGVLKKLGAVVTAPKTHRPEIIGVILDADQSGVTGRWAAIAKRLSSQYLNNDLYDFPEKPSVGGTIIVSKKLGYPRIGVWLMPDNQNLGMLEDFCRTMMPDGAAKQAEHCVATAKAAGYAQYKDVHHTKAVVHTYLAWQDEPGKPLGQAITAQALQPYTPTAQAFAEWLIALFQLEKLSVEPDVS
jgi:hypothetical protein